MDKLAFLSGTAWIVVAMAVVASVEAFVPLFPAAGRQQGRRRANLAMTAQTFATNFLLGVALASLPGTAGAASWMEAGLSGWTVAGTVAQLAAMDFAFGYVAHRTMHASPWLWRFHRVHHSDPFVDVTTTYRTHPVESAWRFAWLAAAAWALAVPPSTLLAYRVLSALNGLLEHANIRVGRVVDAALSPWWVTPDMHKVHHSREQAETDTNYGNLLSIHDRLLGTFTPTGRSRHVVYGLADSPEPPVTLTGLVAMPFVHDDSGVAAQRGIA